MILVKWKTLGIAIFTLLTNIQTTSAELPSTKHFDLTKASYDLFRNKRLHDKSVQQGFAFDNDNRRLFVAQRRDTSSETSGDLCITQLDFEGSYIGYMHLNDFGHGVSFAAQGVGSSTYLWTEVEANKNGYGKKLARFKFVSGKTLSSSSSSLVKFSPVSGASEHTCSIDPIYNHLIVRYHVPNDGKHIAVYDLDEATDGNFTNPLVTFKHPTVKTLSDTFQGYAAYGEYLYLFTGTSYDKSKGVINSELTAFSMNLGRVVQGPTLTKAGSTLVFREPEGLGVYRTVGGEVRLFLGFASEKGRRLSNLFYKKDLI